MLTRHALCFRGAGHEGQVFFLTAVQLRTLQLLRETGHPEAEALSKLCPRCWPFGGAKC
jgi:hypothetical protein